MRKRLLKKKRKKQYVLVQTSPNGYVNMVMSLQEIYQKYGLLLPLNFSGGVFYDELINKKLRS